MAHRSAGSPNTASPSLRQRWGGAVAVHIVEEPVKHSRAADLSRTEPQGARIVSDYLTYLKQRQNKGTPDTTTTPRPVAETELNQI